MGIFHKIKKFLLLSPKTMLLLLEAYVYLGWARILLYIPFQKIAPSLGVQMQETSKTENQIHTTTIKNISHAIHIISKYTFWESKCLVRAIAGMKMLERRKIESTLYLGTTKDKNEKMIAHAWLRSGTIYITGAEEMKRFTIVGKFAYQVSDKRGIRCRTT